MSEPATPLEQIGSASRPAAAPPATPAGAVVSDYEVRSGFLLLNSIEPCQSINTMLHIILNPTPPGGPQVLAVSARGPRTIRGPDLYNDIWA